MPSTPLAIVEAKAWDKMAGDGLPQAIKGPFGAGLGAAGGGVSGFLCKISTITPSAVLMSTSNLISRAAAQARTKHMSFDARMVPQSMRLRAMIVLASPPVPSRPGGEDYQPMTIEHVVIQAAGDKDAPYIQPKSIEQSDISWQNGFGATTSGKEVKAIFDLTALPKGDFDVIVIGTSKEKGSGEKRFLVKKEERRKLRM